MRIAVIANQSDLTLKVKKELVALLAKNQKFTLVDENPEIVLSIGGDGTLLGAFHQYKEELENIQFLGIHTGHLGFYTDWTEVELVQLVEELSQEKFEYLDYPLLQVEILYQNGSKEQLLALNESSVRRLSATLVGDVYISGDLFERFRGDGVSVSTPTGSTGFNKSVGGAVIHPSVNGLQLAEIASLNNRVFRTLGSPLVIGPKEWITIKPNELANFVISCDHLVFEREGIVSISYKIADQRIRFANLKHMKFWERVRQSFIAGEGIEE